MSHAATAPSFARLLSDQRLTRRAVGGDKRAFAAIFRRYHQSLYRFCLAIVGNPDDAHDALQNTMVKVLRALPGEEREIDLKPWLYRIAHNESIDLLRRRRESRELDVEQIAPGYGLAEDAETRDRLRRLIADLKELPERQREVLVMRELSGLGFNEIGAALDCSDAVARQTLYEARQSLRQMDAGREMSCAEVSKALSDGDGRVLRRRDVRAHLRACSSCCAFREEIENREHDFAALAPLPLLAAAGMLNGLAGSHGAGGGLAATLGGGAAQTIGASAAVKGVATAAVVAAIGVTAADQTGVIHLGLPGEQGVEQAKQAPVEPGAGKGSSQGGERAVGRHGASVAGKGKPKARANGSSHQGTAAQGHAHRAQAVPGGPASGLPDQSGGRGREEELPEAATKGQETAAAHQPPEPETGPTNAGEKPATSPVEPTTPDAVPATPPQGPPASPPGAEVVETTPALEGPMSEQGPPEGSIGAEKAAENGF